MDRDYLSLYEQVKKYERMMEEANLKIISCDECGHEWIRTFQNSSCPSCKDTHKTQYQTLNQNRFKYSI